MRRLVSTGPPPSPTLAMTRLASDHDIMWKADRHEQAAKVASLIHFS